MTKQLSNIGKSVPLKKEQLETKAMSTVEECPSIVR